MQRMAEADLAHVPVVIAAQPGKVVGWLTMNDIVRQANARGE